MTAADLPATATLDEGLIWLVVLILIVGSNLALIVWLHVRARRANRERLDRMQIARARRIADARHLDGPLPWPLEHHDRIRVDEPA